MREIVFDTETTGLNPLAGDRLVEIGCIELVNRVETGRTFHGYFNPERPMDAVAQQVHGLSDAFLANKPFFAERVEELLDFLEDSPLVAHNAQFDFAFLNHELGLCGRLKISSLRMIDTLALARTRHPGAKHSLDALCSRFGIDRSHRVRHGALLDAQLLSQVYVELTGGRQIGLSLPVMGEPRGGDAGAAAYIGPAAAAKPAYPARRFEPSPEEVERHRAFLGKLSNPLWLEDSAADQNPSSAVAIDDAGRRA
jgi:DNA polymerase-3 subunit epsilon